MCLHDNKEFTVSIVLCTLAWAVYENEDMRDQQRVNIKQTSAEFIERVDRMTGWE